MMYLFLYSGTVLACSLSFRALTAFSDGSLFTIFDAAFLFLFDPYLRPAQSHNSLQPCSLSLSSHDLYNGSILDDIKRL